MGARRGCAPWGGVSRLLREALLVGLCRECGGGGYLLGNDGDGLHGVLGQVAAVGDGPFVVGLDQDGAGEPEQGFGVGEDADDVGAAFEALMSRGLSS